MIDFNKYDDLRPLLPEEVPAAIEQLLANDSLREIYQSLGASPSWEQLPMVLKGTESIDDFKLRFSAHLVRYVMAKTCQSVAPLQGVEHIELSGAYTYVSNHRDIILDSAFVNVLLDDAGAKFPQIAIGDNLIIKPWVETLVKLNGSFLVRRSLSGREFLLATKALSGYMHDAIKSGISLWIAQREGRAKDSSDHTQPALIKMLSLGANLRGDICTSLKPLHIVPICCSYEYDPCDYLKAREMQLKRDMPEYRKSKQEDALNMYTGVMGYKGRVSFALGQPLEKLMQEISWDEIPESERAERIATLLDGEIHRNYCLFPINYVAADRMQGVQSRAQYYTREEAAEAEAYILKRLALIDMPEGIDRDDAYLIARLWEMYGNPTLNFERASMPI